MNRSNEQDESADASKEEVEQVRKEFLAIACTTNGGRRKRRRQTWVTEWTAERPTDWRPNTVTNPVTGMPFTEEGARRFVIDLLSDPGQEIEEVELRKPPGKKAYVMLAELHPDKPRLYIKIQLGSGVIIGRSFHYSDERGKQLT